MDSTLKTKPMTRDEVSLLLDLIQSRPVITCKETNAAANKCKEEAWDSLTNAFNSKNGQRPRQKEQLKVKWDNLKKAARKWSQEIHINEFKGLKSSEEILEKVSGLLRSTCSRDVPCSQLLGVGATMEATNVSSVETSHNDIECIITLNDASNERLYLSEEAEVVSETSSTGSVQAKKRKIDLCDGSSSDAENSPKYFTSYKKGSSKEDCDVKKSTITRNLAIASYYEKMKEKTDLEIKLLKFEIAEKEKRYSK